MVTSIQRKDAPTPIDWRDHLVRLEGAYSPSTIRHYKVSVAQFVAWCEAEDLTPFPATVETLCAFLELQAESKSPVTVRNRLYAVRKFHQLLGLPDPTAHVDVNLVLRRIRRQSTRRQRQVKGLTHDYLVQCLDAQPADPWGLRNRALISLGYDLLTRRSELVALKTSDVEFMDNGTLRVLIRRSKTDPFGKGRMAFGSARSAELLREWLDWRGTKISPLFCPIYHWKAINRHLSVTIVQDTLRQALMAAGIPASEAAHFSGHSMRVGAAQDLLCAGHDTAAIMRAGGWKSLNALGRYLELAEHNVWA